jgi:hypothetical protein
MLKLLDGVPVLEGQLIKAKLPSLPTRDPRCKPGVSSLPPTPSQALQSPTLGLHVRLRVSLTVLCKSGEAHTKQ